MEFESLNGSDMSRDHSNDEEKLLETDEFVSQPLNVQTKELFKLLKVISLFYYNDW